MLVPPDIPDLYPGTGLIPVMSPIKRILSMTSVAGASIIQSLVRNMITDNLDFVT